MTSEAGGPEKGHGRWTFASWERASIRFVIEGQNGALSRPTSSSWRVERDPWYLASMSPGTPDVLIEGGCLCRAVRYRITARPIVTRVCWCRLCQYLGAGNATVSVCFPTSALTIEGEPRDYPSVADSGNAMHRRFCPLCGTQLFSEAEVRPHLVFVRAGTLDDPEIAQPSATIWSSQAPTWACINPDLPKFAGQPPPAG